MPINLHIYPSYREMVDRDSMEEEFGRVWHLGGKVFSLGRRIQRFGPNSREIMQMIYRKANQITAQNGYDVFWVRFILTLFPGNNEFYVYMYKLLSEYSSVPLPKIVVSDTEEVKGYVRGNLEMGSELRLLSCILPIPYQVQYCDFQLELPSGNGIGRRNRVMCRIYKPTDAQLEIIKSGLIGPLRELIEVSVGRIEGGYIHIVDGNSFRGGLTD